MEVRQVSAEELQVELAKPGVCLVEFWMPGCPACARFAPTYATLAEEFQDMACLIAIDARQNMEIAQKYGVRGVPTVIVFKDGQEVQRSTGAKTLAEMREWLKPVFN